jgi:hypothetical protein
MSKLTLKFEGVPFDSRWGSEKTVTVEVDPSTYSVDELLEEFRLFLISFGCAISSKEKFEVVFTGTEEERAELDEENYLSDTDGFDIKSLDDVDVDSIKLIDNHGGFYYKGE